MSGQGVDRLSISPVIGTILIERAQFVKGKGTLEIVKDISVPYLKVTVRWVKECCEDFFNIGITFIK